MKDKKQIILLLFSTITFWIVALSSLICSICIPKWVGILIGIGFTLIALSLHLCAKKFSPLLYIVSHCINALASGFSIGAYYSYTNVSLPMKYIALLFLPYILLILGICFLIRHMEHTIIAFCICFFTIASLITCCILKAKQSCIYTYSIFLLCIIFFYLILTIMIYRKNSNILLSLSFISFGFYFLIASIVIILITDEDAADSILSCFDLPFSSKKKK